MTNRKYIDSLIPADTTFLLTLQTPNSTIPLGAVMRKITRLSRDRMGIIARRSSESRVSRFPILVLAFFIFLSLQTSCNRAPRLTAIPGTEGVQYNGCNAISISPDEEWIVFWVMADNPSGPYDKRLASLELRTGRLTVHNTSYIPEKFFHTDKPTSALLSCFQIDGWHDARFYIDVFDRYAGSDVVLVPGVTELETARFPMNADCLDCGPSNEFKRISANRPFRSGRRCNSSVAFHNGHFSENTYFHRGAPSTITILRTRAGAEEEVILERSSRFFDLSIGGLRVSPDERYLAFVLGKALLLPIPTATRDVVHILDLQSGEDVPVSPKYRLSTNLMWSRDGSRLYFGGIDLDDRGGIYVVDVAELFE